MVEKQEMGLGYGTRVPKSLVRPVGVFLTWWFGLERPKMQNPKIAKFN